MTKSRKATKRLIDFKLALLDIDENVKLGTAFFILDREMASERVDAASDDYFADRSILRVRRVLREVSSNGSS